MMPNDSSSERPSCLKNLAVMCLPKKWKHTMSMKFRKMATPLLTMKIVSMTRCGTLLMIFRDGKQ